MKRAGRGPGGRDYSGGTRTVQSASWPEGSAGVTTGGPREGGSTGQPEPGPASGPALAAAASSQTAAGEAGQTTAGHGAAAAIGSRLRTPAARRATGHLLLLACYIGAGIGVTWPMTARLTDGMLLGNADISSYVWALWWVAHQVAHLGDPWFTGYMAAPVGIELGFDTLMPLPGLIMTPVTLLFGPAASFAAATIAVPGLLCYAAYRTARLWLGQVGAIAAGAFFGLSTMAVWQNLYHLNISIGTIFLPLTLEATIRLRRRPERRQAIILGVVLGASVLTNQESAVVAALLAVAVLVPWLFRLARKGGGKARWPQLRALALAAVVAVVVASPQLVPMIRQVARGGTSIAPANLAQLTQSYRNYGVGLPTLFAPSPRLAHFHLGQLAASYQFGEGSEGIPTFGVVLAALAVLGLALSWRRGHSWWLALMWVAGAALALGPTLIIGSRTYVPLAQSWHGVTVSRLMPYTWLIRIPGLSALREADRLALLGLLGAAVLAGAAIQWLCRHSRPLVAAGAIAVVAAAGFLEAGWSGNGTRTVPATMTSVDGRIASDHSHSIVVDVPFGLRGGVNVQGFPIPPQALILATADGHPRASSYTSWVPRPTVYGITAIPFYSFLLEAQNGGRFLANGRDMARARRSVRRLNIGWVIVWRTKTEGVRKSAIRYLSSAGFRVSYIVTTADGDITVWKRR